MEEKTSYYLTLTSRVVDDERLSNFEKLLYARITGLTHSTGGCYATDKYFREKCKASLSKIQRALRNLKECGYIYTQITYKDNTKQIKQRIIFLSETLNNVNGVNTNYSNLSIPMVKNDNTPMVKNEHYNNINNNNINNNSIRDIEKEQHIFSDFYSKDESIYSESKSQTLYF